MIAFLRNKKSSDAWLFAGLGNPGDEHAGQRHNIGFMTVDAIAASYGFSAWRSKFQGQLAEGKIENQKVILIKPTTYVNNSGQAVQAACRFYKIAPERIVVFHDELDLGPGRIRIKRAGGNAGHNGLKSIEAHLRSNDFWRVRMGIGHPGDKARVHGYVLHDFGKEEKKWLEPLLEGCARHAGLLTAGDMDGFMSKVAADVKGT